MKLSREKSALHAAFNSKSRTLHPYFTPVAGSFSANFGRNLEAFLAKSRNLVSGVGMLVAESSSAIFRFQRHSHVPNQRYYSFVEVTNWVDERWGSTLVRLTKLQNAIRKTEHCNASTKRGWIYFPNICRGHIAMVLLESVVMLLPLRVGSLNARHSTAARSPFANITIRCVVFLDVRPMSPPWIPVFHDTIILWGRTSRLTDV